MERFSGFVQSGYRFEVMVPTTIYDDKLAVISAYKGRQLAVEAAIGLEEMPRWNVSYQCMELARKDMATLERRTKALIRQLDCR